MVFCTRRRKNRIAERRTGLSEGRSRLSICRGIQRFGKAPDNVKNWKASFTADQVRKACADAGLKLSSIESFENRRKGRVWSGKKLCRQWSEGFRAVVSNCYWREQTEEHVDRFVDFKNDTITFTGRGFGHGVGMSQWGAYALAEDGETAEEIIKHYFTGVEIVQMW